MEQGGMALVMQWVSWGKAKHREMTTKGCAEWMGSEEIENPTWVMERPMPSLGPAMGYQLGQIF
jgi:hypothetical protein